MKVILILLLCVYMLPVTVEDKMEEEDDPHPCLTTDDYPVIDSMLRGTYNMKMTGEVFAHDAAWFVNKDLDQVLVIYLYTDYHRYITYHFRRNSPPEDIKKEMPFGHAKGITLTDSLRNNAFKGFVKQAKEIPGKYFTSEQGFAIGSEKKQLIKYYGNPHEIHNKGGYLVCSWIFPGDSEESIIKADPGELTACNSLGYTVIAYFKKDNLEAMVLRNDFP